MSRRNLAEEVKKRVKDDGTFQEIDADVEITFDSVIVTEHGNTNSELQNKIQEIASSVVSDSGYEMKSNGSQHVVQIKDNL